MTNTRFQIGQIVTANTNFQGLTKGNNYKITDIAITYEVFGKMVTYYIWDDATNEELAIRNGHLILSETE